MTQVRDCILKAPNGIPNCTGNSITLPIGTILLCANGVDSSNAVINDKVTTISELSITASGIISDAVVLFYNNNTKSLIYFLQDNYYR